MTLSEAGVPSPKQQEYSDATVPGYLQFGGLVTTSFGYIVHVFVVVW